MICYMQLVENSLRAVSWKYCAILEVIWQSSGFLLSGPPSYLNTLLTIFILWLMLDRYNSLIHLTDVWNIENK